MEIINNFDTNKYNLIFKLHPKSDPVPKDSGVIVVDKKYTTMDLMKIVEKEIVGENSFPEFKAGDTITVSYKIKEGNKERIQQFRGVVIQRRGKGVTATFTVRKMSGNIGVERIFPVNSPFIDSIEVNKVGSVRRARIFYFRNLTGKKAKIKEKKNVTAAKED